MNTSSTASARIVAAIVLGAIVEKVTGRPLQALLADREVTGQSVHLKGIARPVQVYRVGLG